MHFKEAKGISPLLLFMSVRLTLNLFRICKHMIRPHAYISPTLLISVVGRIATFTNKHADCELLHLK